MQLRFELFVVIVVVAIAHFGCVTSDGPLVRLKDGLVRGLVEEADGGRKVNFFQGIRFGRAERFHKPTPAESWTGVYEATKPRFSCPQNALPNFAIPNITTSEDCLFLNVWQPATSPEPSTNRSVMVWIYGGGFQIGSIFWDLFDAKQISALGDVVVVAVNYRLGPLGFASFGTKETPGNLGLHDQILGLKWVQENIAQFGGNPADVTIFGQSAGSISVGALVLSPLTTGLFHRAIMQSGAPDLKTLLESQNDSLQKTLTFANRIDCRASDLQAALNCLQNKTATELVKTTIPDFINLVSFFPIFGDEVLPIDPQMALQKFDRKVDLLFGLCRNEGSIFMPMMFSNIDLKNVTLIEAKKDIEQILKKVKIPADRWSSIVDHYTKHLMDNSSKNELRIAVSNVLGDFMMDCPTVLFGEQITRRSNGNHFYAYRLMAPLNLSPKQDWMGVTHGEDSMYFFGAPITLNGLVPGITKEQIQLSRDMISSFSQFAKTGQMPAISGVVWNEVLDRQHPDEASSSASYFSLDPADYKMVHNYWNETCDQLWKPLL